MVLLPYPSFQSHLTVKEVVHLSCVGRCRIHPSAAPFSDDQALLPSSFAFIQQVRERYTSILNCCIQLADVDLDSSQNADNEKLLKKKLLKDGVQQTQEFLMEILQLDVSVIEVYVFLPAQDIIRTNGCLASFFLDAGCHTILTDGNSLDALDAAKIPRERLMAHYDSIKAMRTQEGGLDPIKQYCYGVSIDMTPSGDVTVKSVCDIMQTDLDLIVHVQIPVSEQYDIATLVGQVCQQSPDSRCAIGITNPSAQDLGSAYAACLQTDRHDGLFTTVVCTRNGEALGLVYSSTESLVAALESGRGVYYSRSRQGLWRKGDTSGHFQKLHRLDVDCDRDALRFTVTQCGDIPAFCHLNTLTCWGPPLGLRHLEETLQDRLKSAPEGSYTKRLFDDTELLRNKLVEEAQELSEADNRTDVAEELADVLYFAMVRAVKAGVSMDDAVAALDRRSRKVTRRPGDSKAFRVAAGKAILDKQTESNS